MTNQKYYMGLGKEGTEEGWIYKGTREETETQIVLAEEFTNGRPTVYEKSDVKEITKEEYNAIADRLSSEGEAADLINKILERS